MKYGRGTVLLGHPVQLLAPDDVPKQHVVFIRKVVTLTVFKTSQYI